MQKSQLRNQIKCDCNYRCKRWFSNDNYYGPEGVTGKVAVTVRTVKETPKTPKGLDFDKQSITVSVGKDGIVTVKGGAQPYSAVAKDVNIATVSVKENKVNIRGVKAGKTTITVTDKDKKTGTINVTVK